MLGAEYIWLDSCGRLRSKMCFIGHKWEDEKKYPGGLPVLTDASGVGACQIPMWAYDGSSTGQANGEDSDTVLVPVRAVRDPLQTYGFSSVLVLCEVFRPDGIPHPTNTRAKLRAALNAVPATDPWVGFEQEFMMYRGDDLLPYSEDVHLTREQGEFYCGVGAKKAWGRALYTSLIRACHESDLMIAGGNGEVAAGQWEIQIGLRKGAEENPDPLTASDHLQLARYLAHRLGESQSIRIVLDPKPCKDLNGNGLHTNFSTAAMRAEGGREAIDRFIKTLEGRVIPHLKGYGEGNEERLTGEHETASYDEFSYGVADRTKSIRIPRHVAQAGRGYLEDRRPAGNADPYTISRLLIEAVAVDQFDFANS